MEGEEVPNKRKRPAGQPIITWRRKLRRKNYKEKQRLPTNQLSPDTLAMGVKVQAT